MKLINKENDIIKINDFVKDTFTGRIGNLLSFRNNGKERVIAFQDTKTGKIELLSEARVIKVEKEEPKWLSINAKGSQKIVDILVSTIHKYYSVVADNLHKLGYINEKERIELSSAIGETLDFLKERINKRISNVANTEVEEEKIIELIKEENKK